MRLLQHLRPAALRRLGVALAVVAVGTAGALAPVGSPAPAEAGTGSAAPTRFAITARDFSFDAPLRTTAGLNAVSLMNVGADPHHAQVVRLKDGVTVGQFGAAAAESEFAALALITLEGGPGTILPGGRADVILNFNAGNYLLLCFVAGEDEIPHIAKGMVQPFEVVAGAAQAEPAASATVTMFDFGFQMPQSVAAGQQTWKIVNQGPQPHEMNLLKAGPGTTVASIGAFLADMENQPEPDVMPAGGMQGLEAGKTGWLVADLTPGTYIAICFIPDPASGKPHFELGMVTPFTVR